MIEIEIFLINDFLFKNQYFFIMKIFQPQMKNLRKQKTSGRRKQRKAHFTASNGERRIRMSSHLSKELRREYGFRSFPIRVGDTVIVNGGKFNKKEGVVSQVKYSEYKVYIEGCFVTKNDGTNVLVPTNSSNLTIIKFFLGQGRDKQLEKKKNAREEHMRILERRREEITIN